MCKPFRVLKRHFVISKDMLAQLSMRHGMTGANSQRDLVKLLRRRQAITTDSVEKAFLENDRRLFCTPGTVEGCYNDEPIKLGKNASITAPYLHAISLEGFGDMRRKAFLDIGCGTGYLLACALSLGANRAVGVDIIPSIVEFGRQAVPSGEFIVGDAFNLLLPAESFDCINVGFCPGGSVPLEFLALLKPGGKMVIPLHGNAETEQILTVVEKEAGDVYGMSKLVLCAFAPRTYPQVKRPSLSTEEITVKMKEWRCQFAARTGKVPSLLDMQSDPEISKLLQYLAH